MRKYMTSLSVLLLFALLCACGASNDTASDAEKYVRATLVTVSPIQYQPIEITQTSVGSLEGLVSPTLAAEMAGHVVKVHVNTGDAVEKGQLIATLDATDSIMQRNEAQAEVGRIEALLTNQAKIVARNKTLVSQHFISQTAVDNEIAQENVLTQELKAAKAKVSSINHDSSKSKIYAPVSGVIESKPVDTGDYVRVGDPIVQIVSTKILRAHLPFPEQFGPKLKAGLKVRLKTPTSDEVIETEIRELKPQVVEGNRTIDVIADVNNATNWQPGATVTGTVLLGELPAAIMVPEQSLVLRPTGEVIYVVRDHTAYQAIVKTGIRQNGLIEILSGLTVNDTVVVDGAGFLTDNTPVKIATDDAT